MTGYLFYFFEKKKKNLLQAGERIKFAYTIPVVPEHSPP